MEHVDLSASQADVAKVKAAFGASPSVALVLGSGLDRLSDALEGRVDVPYTELEGMSVDRQVAGHSGTLTLGNSGNTVVAAFRGRIHRYQGVSAYRAAYPARLAAALGAETLVVTNAAGSVDLALSAGDIMLITDHLNLMGDNPLVGWPGPEGGNPFVAMGDAYDTALRELAHECASDTGVELREGVYAGLLGPSYETPAEASYLRTIGASAAGMSTVPEVIAARALGLRVLGLSVITNKAGGSELSHEEVLEAGRRSSDALIMLLSAILGRL